jgi:hypothetical protein
MKAALVLAAFLTAVLAGTDDYFAVDGAATDSKAGFVSTCNVPSKPNYHPEAPIYPVGPLPDFTVELNVFGANLQESVLLQIADLNSADVALAGLVPCDPATGKNAQGLEWLPRTNASVSKRTTYLHKIRCADGAHGQMVKTSSSVYKKCPGDGAGLQVVLTFQLPPSLCQQTCDKKSDCEAYMVDAIGQNCWILNGDGNVDRYNQEGYLMYWRVGSIDPPLQKAPKNMNVLTRALDIVAQTTLNTSSNNYFAIDGAHAVAKGSEGDEFVATCNVPFNGTRPFWPDLPMFPHGPLPDLKVQMKLLGANLPESTILQIADANSADMALAGVGGPTRSTPQSLEWQPRTNASVSKRTTYFHQTRCAGGADGQQVKTASSIYKKCSGDESELIVALTFQLPPELCKNTCDKKSDCVAYTVDAIGQNCWILTNTGGETRFNMYWLVG